MKTFALALCAILSLSMPSFAQSPGAAAPSPDAASAPADEGGGGDAKSGGNNKMKELMQTCRSQAKGQGLKGHDMRQAVVDCVVKERPGMADRLKCRMAGLDKGMKPGDDLKTYVKDCMKKSG